MKRRISIFMFFVLVSSISLAQSKVGLIDDLMTRYYNFGQFSGSVLVADKGEIIYEKGFGMANAELGVPNSPEFKYRIGSITKQFTSMIIMQLVKEGKLKTSEKLSELLPYYRKDTGDKVTLHQLLTHTSGIPSYTNDPNFFKEFSRDHYDPQDFVEKFCSSDLEFEPGSKFSYNNSGYFIIGAIIEHVTGKTYEENLKERILQPLGMNNTGYDHYDEIIMNRASGYSKNFAEYKNAPYLDMSIPYAAGSMYSSVKDLYKWDRALAEFKLLPEDYSKVMFTPYEVRTGGKYAYGWIVGKNKYEGLPDSMYFTLHGGGIHGFSSLITRFPEEGQLVVLLNNYAGFSGADITEQIVKILHGLEFNYPKQGISYKVYEILNDDGIKAAVDMYKAIKEEEADAFTFGENELNNLGYYLMNKNRLDEAIEILKLNIEEYPDNANPYDSMGEAYLKKGNKELAIKNYKKSLDLNPGNSGAMEKLKELGVEYKTESISVSNDVLSKYEGKYELVPNFIITIRVDGEHLFAKATGQSELEIYPKSETEFFYKVVEAQIKFIIDETGNAESLILFQNGREMPAKKIE